MGKKERERRKRWIHRWPARSFGHLVLNGVRRTSGYKTEWVQLCCWLIGESFSFFFFCIEPFRRCRQPRPRRRRRRRGVDGDLLWLVTHLLIVQLDRQRDHEINGLIDDKYNRENNQQTKSSKLEKYKLQTRPTILTWIFPEKKELLIRITKKDQDQHLFENINLNFVF